MLTEPRSLAVGLDLSHSPLHQQATKKITTMIDEEVNLVSSEGSGINLPNVLADA